METLTTSLTWLRPEWLWALVPVLLAMVYLPSQEGQHNPWAKVCDAPLYAALTKQTKDHRNSLWPRLITCLGLMCLVIALAGPSWQERLQPVVKKDSVVVIALDMSPAMMDNDLPPSRLARAKFKINDLLKNWQEGSVGLIAYTQEAFVASPLTTDSKTLTALLPALQFNIMPVRGSDLSKALLEAEKLIQQSRFKEGHILVITAAHVPDTALSLAKRLAKESIHTHVYALRTDDQYDQLSQAGQGKSWQFSHDDSDMKKLATYFSEYQTQQHQQTQQVFSQRLDQGHRLLWLLLPLALLAFRRGWLESFVE